MYQIYILYIIVITKLAPILVNKSHFFSHFFVHFSTHKKVISSSSTSNPPQCHAPGASRIWWDLAGAGAVGERTLAVDIYDKAIDYSKSNPFSIQEFRDEEPFDATRTRP